MRGRITWLHKKIVVGIEEEQASTKGRGKVKKVMHEYKEGS